MSLVSLVSVCMKMGEVTGPGFAWDQVEMLWSKGGKQSRGSSQLVPLMMGDGGRKCAGWWAWSDLYLAAVHSDMNCTLASTELSMGRLWIG